MGERGGEGRGKEEQRERDEGCKEGEESANKKRSHARGVRDVVFARKPRRSAGVTFILTRSSSFLPPPSAAARSSRRKNDLLSSGTRATGVDEQISPLRGEKCPRRFVVAPEKFSAWHIYTYRDEID